MKNLNKNMIAAASACAVSVISSTAIANDNQYTPVGVEKKQKQDDTRYIVVFKEQGHAALYDAAQKAGTSIKEARKAANSRILAAHGAKMALNLDSVNGAAVNLSAKQLKALSKDASVAYVEVNPKRYLIAPVNRSFASAQRNVAPQAESNPYGIALVQADQVSDANTGNRSVCIMDTGYEGNHEDLLPYTSSLVTGDDNDGLGNDTGNWWTPGHPHGTHLAGTIAALGGNGKGVTSVNPSGLLKVHNIKVFNDAGSWGYGSDLVKAVEQCQAAGANVVSMSLGGGASSTAESTAFANAAAAGLLHIAAAGNDGNSSMSYPASYDSVMSVGAVNSSKSVASFSQYNSQVEISAPGVSVNSTVLNNGYASYDGTSMATPHVSGVAALVWSHYTQCSAAQIRNALTATSEDLGAAGRDIYYGHGLVQAKAMYDALAVSCDVTALPPAAGVLAKGVAQTGLSGAASSEQNFTFDVPAGATDITVTMNGGTGDLIYILSLALHRQLLAMTVVRMRTVIMILVH